MANSVLKLTLVYCCEVLFRVYTPCSGVSKKLANYIYTSACGIIPKEKFILGETVCFSVLQEGYLPILEFNTHDFLINQIENMIDSINLNAHAYSVGDIISLSTIN